MLHMKKRAFSLLELMVVIGLISLLMAMATPYYIDYANKSKVALAALVLNELNTKTMALYNEGKVTPGIASISIDGTTFLDNSSVAMDNPNVTDAVFLAPGDGFLNNNAWMFCVSVANLSYPHAVSGTHSRLCSKVVVNNGIFTTYCGTWTQTDNGLEVLAEYLPEQCNYPEVSSY